MPLGPSKSAPVIIVGAGIFGLSTALHLARRGYIDVTVFDKQPYHNTLYSYFLGCDAASADLNKIIRSGYGSQSEYQELTFEAISAWKTWNDELERGEDLPPGLSAEDRVFINCGNLSLTDGDMLPEFEKATIRSMEERGHAGTQLVTTEKPDVKRAAELGLEFAMDPFRREERGKVNVGVLDCTGGMAVADKACRVAMHKAERQGVKFVLGSVRGSFKDFVTRDSGQIAGIVTKDEKEHLAELTIIACGGWTPTILPDLDGICETAAGSVIHFKIPRESDLWNRFSPDSFPTWAWKIRDGADGGLYGFPRDDNGYLKIGYRGTKYTNPVKQIDGVERSVPITRWSEGEKLKQIPEKAMSVLRYFVDEYIPEFKEQGIVVHSTRTCWYTDSFDNHFVIDHVPNRKGLFVATGGSGHAFKYLPNIGNWVVDIMEGLGGERPAVQAWKWRKLGHQTPANILMEGKNGTRALQNVPLTKHQELGEELEVKI
ncbi:putative sarcosine oxidase [Dendryphion nanum]|uniref:Sarcosine oxidase n=1 Tax=Dendryphion nanum TaxID=256645 RepID=A0A9P9IKM7_9PLEO|nr:putative sarcosine oxidase [Dendryphion nanum]